MKKAVRHLEKKVRAAISAKNKEEAETLLRSYTRAIDKAAQKGKYHVKTASRKVSRLTQFMNKSMNA